MKREFTHDDFEDFLKRSADSLRMKAPDRVWQKLSRDLGKRRRHRILTGLSAFLLLTSAAGYYIATDTTTQKIAVGEDKQPTIRHTPADKNTGTGAEATLPANEAKVVLMQSRPSTLDNETRPVSSHQSLSASLNTNTKTQVAEKSSSPTGTTFLTASNFNPTVVDSYPEPDAQATASLTDFKSASQKMPEALPLTIESVTNAYKRRQTAKRFETQLHFTPTVSYRKLSENKSYLRGVNPATAASGYPALYSSVNNHVTHKPDVGFELGLATKYLLSDHIKLRTGLQFNVNRYDVKAFSSSGSVATIALNNGSGIDSLNTYSRYSNINGYKSNWLQNLSFQVSVPVGVEYIFKGDDKVHFGIAATVQPTYVLGDRAYLITTDYKNYTEVPWLVRRWNVNTSMETFVAYKRWQFGPQVRYQLLSSFESKYPVKENLFDFGLKIGLTLNK